MQCKYKETIDHQNGRFTYTTCISEADIILLDDPCFGLCSYHAYEKTKAEIDIGNLALQAMAKANLQLENELKAKDEEIARLTAEFEKYRQANVKCAQAIFGLEDTIDRLTAENTTIKEDYDKLNEAISVCVGIIRASGQVNTKLLADKLEEALKGKL
ncbi:MAG: hypothetical protein MUP81_01785 [Dehalococcoidia bacterium]|nr:hypothetical protein [Dehalococcoidia bacterium]